MATQYFSIKEQLFEIDFANRGRVSELQDKISRINSERITSAMDDCFEKLVPPDALIKLDSLTIDIGEISFDALDNDLEPRIIDALEQQLSNVLMVLLRDGQTDEAEGAVLTPISTNEEILEHFLLNGILPWWVQRDTNFNLRVVVDELFRQHPDLLRALLLRTGRHEFVRRRLVQQFDTVVMQQLVTVLEPSEAAYIIGYHTEVVELQRKAQLVPSETASFEKAVWLFVLNYLLNERGGDFNRKAFVKSNLEQMAAYFSVEYFDLLVLFYRALALQQQQSLPVSSLETFIRELTSEEESLRTAQFTAIKYVADPLLQHDPETLAGKAELLVYYFRFGTLPEGNNGYSMSALADLFSELVRHVPASLRNILFSLQGEANFSHNWYVLFGAERGKELLNVLYPVTGRLMNTLSSLIEWIQSNQPVFDTDISSLKKILANISVAHIVFSEADTVREIDLVRSFLAQLAAHYQSDTQQLTKSVYKALQETFRQGINNSRLPQLINELNSESPQDFNSRQSILFKDNETDDELTEADPYFFNGLVDTLTYLIQYGNIPWWGRNFFDGTTSDERFNELMISYPLALQELIRIAGSEPRWQARMVSFVSVETMFRILQTLPGGTEGVAALEQLLEWVDRPLRAQQSQADMAAKILLQAVWDDIAHHAYRSFSLTGFYSLAVVRLSAQLGIRPLELVHTLQKAAIKKVGGTVEERNILADLVVILKDYDLPGSITRSKEIFRKGRSAAVSPEIQKDQELEVMLMLSNSVPQDGLVTTDKLGSEALRLIEYFFTWNRLPGDWDETIYLPLNIMLKQMLMLTFRDNRPGLETLLKNQTHIPAARIFFHELVAESKGGMEKQLALFIAPYREDYQRRVIETSLADTTQLQIQSSMQTDQPLALPAAGLTDWIQWIEAFLTTGQLPSQANSNEKIRSIMIQLYLADKQVVKKILDKKDHNALARVHLHDMFIGQPGYLEREVWRIMDAYREQDIVAFLKTRDIGIDLGETEKILLRLLTPGKKIKDFVDFRELVMSSPSFIQYLTGNTNNAGLKIFIERTGIGWGEDTVTLMQGLRELFAEAIPGNLERDKLNSLLLQFNLLFLSGRLYIRTSKAYLQAFFAFVHQSVAYSLPVGVWKNVITHIGRKKDFAPAISPDQLQTVEKELQSIIRRDDDLHKRSIDLAETEMDEEWQRQRARRLEEIRAELEKERLREEERREKEFRKLQEDKNNKIYIRNAGLVLLHPFLGTYFTRLGLMEQGKFIDDASQYRAVLLLQYLLNGRSESEEFELPLNKILCGLSLEEAIPLQIELSEDEIAVSAEIFQVIFQRWDKMKNSSVEGFRASFLQREGALSRGEENWELRVEQRTYDMLLDTLPWAFGMIKNTWMTKILMVEWN